MYNSRIFCCTALAIALTSCSGGGGGSSSASVAPSTPQPVTLSSTYSGTETANNVSAPIALSISQSGSQLTGGWGNEFGGFANSGTLIGSINGSTFNATLTPNIPISGECATTASGTVNGNTITGNFATVSGCSTPQTGSFSVQSASAPPTISGNKSGTLNDAVAGSGTISTTITQNGVVLGGTFTDAFASGVPGNPGQIYGVVINSNVYFDLIPSSSTACPFSAVGAINGVNLVGNYTAVLCSGSDQGSFTIGL